MFDVVDESPLKRSWVQSAFTFPAGRGFRLGLLRIGARVPEEDRCCGDAVSTGVYSWGKGMWDIPW